MDINAQNGDISFSVRTAGVLIRDGKVLLQHEKGGDEYAFPGGTLKFGETSVECLEREWKEELGVKIKVGRLLWVEESFWEYGGRLRQSLVFYFEIILRTGEIAENTHQRDNDLVLLEWHPIEKIGEITLYPTFASSELTSLCDYPKHFVTRD